MRGVRSRGLPFHLGGAHVEGDRVPLGTARSLAAASRESGVGTMPMPWQLRARRAWWVPASREPGGANQCRCPGGPRARRRGGSRLPGNRGYEHHDPPGGLALDAVLGWAPGNPGRLQWASSEDPTELGGGLPGAPGSRESGKAILGTRSCARRPAAIALRDGSPRSVASRRTIRMHSFAIAFACLRAWTLLLDPTSPACALRSRLPLEPGSCSARGSGLDRIGLRLVNRGQLCSPLKGERMAGFPGSRESDRSWEPRSRARRPAAIASCRWAPAICRTCVAQNESPAALRSCSLAPELSTFCPDGASALRSMLPSIAAAPGSRVLAGRAARGPRRRTGVSEPRRIETPVEHGSWRSRFPGSRESDPAHDEAGRLGQAAIGLCEGQLPGAGNRGRSAFPRLCDRVRVPATNSARP